MKFFTVAAICALASSVSSLKISNHLEDIKFSHQDQQQKNPSTDSNLTKRPGKPQYGSFAPKRGQKGQNDRFDWKNWQNPCPNKDDKSCWNQWFNSQFTCKTDDKQCWVDSLKKLPCPLISQSCWTDHIDTFPCKRGDSACWGEILPSTLPCKLDDGACWGKLRWGDKKGGDRVMKRHQVNEYFEGEQDSYGLKSLFNDDEDKHMKANDYFDTEDESYGLNSLFDQEDDQSHFKRQEKDDKFQNPDEKVSVNEKGKRKQNKYNKEKSQIIEGKENIEVKWMNENRGNKENKSQQEKKDKNDNKDKEQKKDKPEDSSSNDKPQDKSTIPPKQVSPDSSVSGTTTPTQN